MTKAKLEKVAKANTLVVNQADDRKGELKSIGGSQSDHWNLLLANQAIQALWLHNPMWRRANGRPGRS